MPVAPPLARANTLGLTLAAAAVLSWSPLAMGHGGNANSAPWDICADSAVGGDLQLHRSPRRPPSRHLPVFMDGFAMHEMTNADGAEPSDLDSCRGHSDETRGYHYHVSGAGENMISGCWNGLTVNMGGPP